QEDGGLGRGRDGRRPARGHPGCGLCGRLVAGPDPEANCPLGRDGKHVATKNGKPANGENIARAVTEVSERVSVLVREELELAKVEVTRKITSIAKGAVAVGAGAVFGVFVVIFGLMALAWGISAIVVDGVGNIWIGFAAVAGIMLVLAI